MALPTHINELIKKLRQKTIEKKITWTRTSRESEYFWSFKEGSVTIDVWNADGLARADIAVYNVDGGQIERHAFDDSEEEFSILSDLYGDIKRSILKSDETYNSLFDELDKL